MRRSAHVARLRPARRRLGSVRHSRATRSTPSAASTRRCSAARVRGSGSGRPRYRGRPASRPWRSAAAAAASRSSAGSAASSASTGSSSASRAPARASPSSRVERHGVVEPEAAGRRCAAARQGARRSPAPRRGPRPARGCRCPCCRSRRASRIGGVPRQELERVDIDVARGRAGSRFPRARIRSRRGRRASAPSARRHLRIAAAESRQHGLDVVAREHARRRRDDVALGVAGRRAPRRSAPWRRSPCRASSSDCANLVASPKHSGRSPDASGSSVPVWPAFSASNRRFAACSAAFDVMPDGLSSSSTPSTRRRARRHRRAAPSAVGASVRGDGVVDQLREVHARLDRVVVGEVQLRHGVEDKPARERAAQEAGRVRQRRDRLVGMRRPARCVKWTFACDRSAVTSTSVIVTGRRAGP